MDLFTGSMEKFGSHFQVAAMIPSLAFVIATMVVFNPILGISMYFQDERGIYQLLGISLFVTIPTVIIGFTLTALNTYILKFFEGYVFLHRFTFARKSQQKKAQRIINQLNYLKKRISRLENIHDRSLRANKSLKNLKNRYYELASDYDENYPPSIEQVLPTRFGNILRAAEAYPGTRYGIDAVPLWPRMIHVVPPSYLKVVNESRNELSFLINICVLSIGFSGLSLIIALYEFLATRLPYLHAISDSTHFSRYIVSGFLAIICAWFFHRASLVMVGSFGVMIRSAYDLFRFQLLEQMKLELPKNLNKEFKVWKNLGEFIVLGSLSIEFKSKSLKYSRPSKEKQ